MNINAKENVKLILISLAFFFMQFLFCGTFYGEATDTFWIQNLLQQGISGYVVFYIGVSRVLALLFHFFNTVPWNSILLYGMLFYTFILTVKFLKKEFNVLLVGAIVFVLLFSDALLLLDFTQVTILTSIVTLLYLSEQKTMNWYTYLSCLTLLVVSFLLRNKSVIFAGLLLLPYFIYKFHSIVKKRFVLPFVVCFGVMLVLKLSAGVQSYSHQNSIRAKLSDYQLKVSAIGFTEQELFELKCVSVGLPIQSYSVKVEGLVNDLSLIRHVNLSKSIQEVRWLGRRLVGTYVIVVLAMFGLLILNIKWKNLLLIVYVFGVLVVMACFLKLPDRLLQPALVGLLLMLFLLNEPLHVCSLKGVLISVVMVLSVVRLGVKSSALKNIQLKNESALCMNSAKGTIRSSNISNRVMYLNPLKTYSGYSISRTVPLTGWVGLLPQVVELNNEIDAVQLDGDVTFLERWLDCELELLDSTKGLYKTKKDTSN